MNMNNLLSVNQVAFILKVHPLTIRRYINTGKLKAIKLGGNVRIEEASLSLLQRDIRPHAPAQGSLIKIKKLPVHPFDENDPLLRLKGRGASLT